MLSAKQIEHKQANTTMNKILWWVENLFNESENESEIESSYLKSIAKLNVHSVVHEISLASELNECFHRFIKWLLYLTFSLIKDFYTSRESDVSSNVFIKIEWFIF